MEKRRIFKTFTHIFLFSSLFSLVLDGMELHALWKMTGGAGDPTGSIVRLVIFRVVIPVALVIAAHCLDKNRKE